MSAYRRSILKQRFCASPACGGSGEVYERLPALDPETAFLRLARLRYRVITSFDLISRTCAIFLFFVAAKGGGVLSMDQRTGTQVIEMIQEIPCSEMCGIDSACGRGV